MANVKTRYFLLLGVVTCFTFQSPVILAQGTAFTYQGKLTDGANAAGGTYDLIFSLWDAATGGAQVGTSVAKPATVISNGLFTVSLDFGSSFAGGNRWLEIGVRTNAANAYTTLAPRQPVTAAPYAVTAGTAMGLSIPPGMALISGGVFTMGNAISADTDIFSAPLTSFSVSSFYMDVNLVTLSQWDSVYHWATNHGYTFVDRGAGKAANHPVQTVDWYDAVKWCNARSEQSGRVPVYYTDVTQTVVYRTNEIALTNGCANWTANGYRLPTEAEWEKAARGGVTGQRFPWGNVIDGNLANYYGVTQDYDYDLGPDGYNPSWSMGGVTPFTSPVGFYAANGYGLYDMVGNVTQWCWDWYGPTYSGDDDPRGPDSGTYRIYRGGSWLYDASYARCAFRNLTSPRDALNYIGFRCVCSH